MLGFRRAGHQAKLGDAADEEGYGWRGACPGAGAAGDGVGPAGAAASGDSDRRKRCRQRRLPPRRRADVAPGARSEEHTSELQSLMRISYAVFCLKKKTVQNIQSD